ncbi:MAG TPA: hemerythrin domain-containing protein [Polyangiaceae bacterium]|nr:hemerythrin domain-containing protein [Polyangiaceae bacterium]
MHSPLPTFFGRLTTVLSEHEHLRETLRSLTTTCSALEAGQMTLPPELEPRRLIQELCAALSTHFEAEEGRAHFGTMAQERPDLLPGIVDLKTEHRVMLEMVRNLALVVEDPARWSELPAPARALSAALRAHEQAEAELVGRYISGKRER